ncbi:hypothetical protein PMI09_02785 [Rhizobium sp. CF122]|nr:hypothetical protein [Rhizobium sp. CF122]EJL53920.1 hypothetical protein PMI09_02785 [Rhizobium sp. CF122]
MIRSCCVTEDDEVCTGLLHLTKSVAEASGDVENISFGFFG